MFLRAFLLLLFLLPLSNNGYSQGKFEVTDIPALSGWCSDKNEFSVHKLEKVIPTNNCSKTKFAYGKFLRFKAKSNFIDAVVKIDYSKKSLKEPVLFLMDENLQPIDCVNKAPGSKSLGLFYDKLEKKKYYVIGILTAYEEKNGKFTICMNDNVSSNNTYFGATEISSVTNYCTPKPILSVNYTPTTPKIKSLSEGPNHNSWFKFTARTKFLEVDVKAVNKMGKFEYPYIGLFDNSLKQITSIGYDDANHALLRYYDLKPGDSYFISVDQKMYKRSMGGYNICTNDILDTNYYGVYRIAGKLRDDQAKSKVYLIDNETGKRVAMVYSDDNGVFAFENLPEEVSYTVEVENKDYPLDVNLFMFDANNNIIKSGELNDNIPIIDKNTKTYKNSLISESDISAILVPKSKTAIIGNVVLKKSPFTKVSNLKVQLLDNNNEIFDSQATDENGGFIFNALKPSKRYSIKFVEESEDLLYAEMSYINDKNEVMMYSSSDLRDESGKFHFNKLPKAKVNIDLLEMEDSSPSDFDFSLGKSMVLNNLFFGLGKSTLLEGSFTELDDLARELNFVTDISIKIKGYTDNQGDKQKNIQLSENRAKAVVDYLISKNISESRLSYVGFGESNPIATNETKEGRQKNRRVEIVFGED